MTEHPEEHRTEGAEQAVGATASETKPANQVTISLEPESLSIRVHQVSAFKALVSGDWGDREIIWASSDSDIASIDGRGDRGVVKGVCAGRARITAVVKGANVFTEGDVTVV